jgi:adenylosuccinate synthase
VLPYGAAAVANSEPVLEEMPGWTESTVGVTDYDKLPVNAQNYLKRVSEVCGVGIDLVSTGPDRLETIVLRHPFKA